MKKSLIFFAVAISMLVLLTSELEYSGGTPGAKTGSPGDNGANCTQCHAGTPNSVDEWIESNIPDDGYVAGEIYTITVTGTHSGVGKFGFEATAEDSQNAKTGTFTIINGDETKLANGNQAVTHTSGGTTPSGNTKTWTFNWTAPEAGTGNVSFYAAFNAANGNSSTSGDVIYLSNLTVSENVGTGIDDSPIENVVSIYPVPFDSQIYVNCEMEVSEVALYNSAGTLVKKMTVNNSLDNTLSLNTGNLEAGVYIVSVIGTNGERISRQIVKTK